MLLDIVIYLFFLGGGRRIGVGGFFLRIEKLWRFIIIFNEVIIIILIESERNCMNKNYYLNFKIILIYIN